MFLLEVKKLCLNFFIDFCNMLLPKLTNMQLDVG